MRSRGAAWVVTLAMLGCVTTGAVATTEADRPLPRPRQAELGAFVDGVVEASMRRDRLAGVSLAIVQEGEISLLRGYGLARIEPETAVDPVATLFRIGSISKTFVWVAMMQLLEDGLLSLEDPINDHLPDQLDVSEEGFTAPIRIRHLMTHTPGFEDTALGHLFTRDASELQTLHDYLEGHRPARVRPAGDHTTYSNYGAGLAGYIVSAVSGMEFESYVEERIFGPLGMRRSTFREPHGEVAPEGLPRPMQADLAADSAQGLEWEEGAWVPKEFEFITPIGPAGAMSSSAADMARYMLALLGQGQLEGERVLESASVGKMRRTLFANADGMSGLAHGFLQYSIPGRYENFGHGGATLHFMSNMVLVPELGLGIFVTTNSGPGRELVTALPVLMIERFFDQPEVGPEPPPDFAERGEVYAGTYLTTRRAYTLLEKIAAITEVTKVTVTDDGYLVTVAGDDSVRWVEIGSNLFRESGGDRHIAFRQDESGRVTHIFHSFGITAGERISFFGGAGWLALILVVGLVGSVGMVIGGWLRRHRDIHQTPGERWAGRLMPVQGLLWITFFLLLALAIAQAAAQPEEALYAFPGPLLVGALSVLLVVHTGTLLAVLSLVPVWRHRSWPRWRRVRHTLAVLIQVALSVTLDHWNMLGFRYF